MRLPVSIVPRNSTNPDVQAQAAVVTARTEVEEAATRFDLAAENLGVDRPPPLELRQLCRQVAGFTAELFPGAMGVEVRVDPEIPDDLYLVFQVGATASVDEIVQRDAEWHRRLVGVARRWPGMFRLSIDAR
jgi:hypothetical protein